MGSVNTQTRTLAKVNSLYKRREGMGEFYEYGNFPALDAVQKTTSFRSVRAKPGSSLTPEDWQSQLEDFADVTRNGFTEKNPRYDTGHDFFTTKTSFSTTHPNWRSKWIDRNGNAQEQYGPLVIASGRSPYTLQMPSDVSYISALANKYGSQAISRTIPTASPVSLATFLGELAVGLPIISSMDYFTKTGNKQSTLKKLGRDHIVSEFGVKPLISDARKILEAVVKSSQTLQQYHRDSGRQIRRRFNFDPIREETLTEELTNVGWGGGQSGLYGFWPNELRQVLVSTKTLKTQRIWFSGAYSYHLSTDDDLISRFVQYEKDANRILGSRITAEVLWELGPWSWLLDWKYNIGDIISNATLIGQDGLVLRYGYLMCHTRVKSTSSIPSVTFAGGAESGRVSNTVTRETKERLRATPYGFGVTAGGFNAKQWTILGALGLTMAPNKLH